MPCLSHQNSGWSSKLSKRLCLKVLHPYKWPEFKWFIIIHPTFSINTTILRYWPIFGRTRIPAFLSAEGPVRHAEGHSEAVAGWDRIGSRRHWQSDRRAESGEAAAAKGWDSGAIMRYLQLEVFVNQLRNRGPLVLRAFPTRDRIHMPWTSGGFGKSRSMEVGGWGQSATQQRSE